MRGEAELCAVGIFRTYRRYRLKFREITRRGCRRFLERDWGDPKRDVVARIDLYSSAISLLMRVVKRRLGERIEDPSLWAETKRLYGERIAPLPDANIARTFFNSVTRKVFHTVGVDPLVEFIAPGPIPSPALTGSSVLRSITRRDESVDALIDRVLDRTPLNGLFHDRQATVRQIADEVENATRSAWGDRPIDRIDFVDGLFCRGFGAYVVARMRAGDSVLPLAMSFLAPDRGVVIDAVLADEDAVSIAFSFTRSYFLFDTETPREVVEFLRSIMPRKPVAELYTALGYNKHGKTVLYGELFRHLESAPDRFVPAPGEPGMVMIVFTIPSYDVVFKVIRDRFAYPKTTTRRDVEDRYRFVFRRDRAGRLADAQQFEHLRFDQRLFSDELLEELTRDASETVRFEDGFVVLDHLYTERRMIPLNLFLREADPASARLAVLDYGQAIKDLAASNIFTGDLLLKNFGVTRHGRVIFYDYDELALLTDCRFRNLPEPDDDDDEMRSEAWFYVGPDDIFPEEFPRFLGLSDELMAVLENAHGKLFDPAYWRAMQAAHREEVHTSILAYPYAKRRRGPGAYLTDAD